jgi:hypothetical protein
MTTYQRAIEILGKDETDALLNEAINEALRIGVFKVPPIQAFKPWIETFEIKVPKVINTVFEYSCNRVFLRQMKFEDVTRQWRNKEATMIRHILRWHYYQFPEMNLKAVSKHVLKCHHTTALHSINHVNDMIAIKDAEYVNAVNSLKTFCAENQIFTID